MIICRSSRGNEELLWLLHMSEIIDTNNACDARLDFV